MLMVACKKNALGCVNFLLEKGANVKQKYGKFANTALHQASCHGTAQIAELLLKHGADVHVVDDFGRTPLFYANHVHTVRVLIAHGADVHAMDADGNYALFGYEQGYIVGTPNVNQISFSRYIANACAEELRRAMATADVTSQLLTADASSTQATTCRPKHQLPNNTHRAKRQKKASCDVPDLTTINQSLMAENASLKAQLAAALSRINELQNNNQPDDDDWELIDDQA